MERIGEIGVSECTASGSGPIFRYANRLSLLPLFAAETLAAACQAAGVAFRYAVLRVLVSFAIFVCFRLVDFRTILSAIR